MELVGGAEEWVALKLNEGQGWMISSSSQLRQVEKEDE